MKEPTFSRGILSLAQAMIAAGHTRDDLRELTGMSIGHVGHILAGTRGVGLTLALRLEATHQVSPVAWETAATPEDIALIRQTVPRIPKRHPAPAPAPEVSPVSPEAA